MLKLSIYVVEIEKKNFQYSKNVLFNQLVLHSHFHHFQDFSLNTSRILIISNMFKYFQVKLSDITGRLSEIFNCLRFSLGKTNSLTFPGFPDLTTMTFQSKNILHARLVKVYFQLINIWDFKEYNTLK